MERRLGSRMGRRMESRMESRMERGMERSMARALGNVATKSSRVSPSSRIGGMGRDLLLVVPGGKKPQTPGGGRAHLHAYGKEDENVRRGM